MWPTKWDNTTAPEGSQPRRKTPSTHPQTITSIPGYLPGKRPANRLQNPTNSMQPLGRLTALPSSLIGDASLTVTDQTPKLLAAAITFTRWKIVWAPTHSQTNAKRRHLISHLRPKHLIGSRLGVALNPPTHLLHSAVQMLSHAALAQLQNDIHHTIPLGLMKIFPCTRHNNA